MTGFWQDKYLIWRWVMIALGGVVIIFATTAFAGYYKDVTSDAAYERGKEDGWAEGYAAGERAGRKAGSSLPKPKVANIKVKVIE